MSSDSLPYTDAPEQDEVFGIFERFGFRYDGQSLWSASLYSHELFALASALAAVHHEAPEPNDPEPIGEVVGYHKVGFAELATVAWSGERPKVGTALYAGPSSSDDGIREALARLVALSDNGGGSRAQWERAMEAARAALAGTSK